MAKSIYFGFALASSMFSGDVTISRKVISPEMAKNIIEAGIISCINGSHKATIDTLEPRFGISGIEVPEKPPVVSLQNGDSVLVLGVRGLPRLEDRHHYTDDEVAKATFEFVLYTVK